MSPMANAPIVSRTGRVVALTGFALALLAGFWARLWAAQFFSNFDIESYIQIADLVHRGLNIYANTFRYNYGPIWAGVVWVVRIVGREVGYETLDQFHLLIAGVLSAADVGIAILLARREAFGVAALFILSPVSVIITGYFSQFDNVAILFALASWYLLNRARLT